LPCCGPVAATLAVEAMAGEPATPALTRLASSRQTPADRSDT